MNKFVAACIAVVFSATASFAADPVMGTWKTQEDEGAYAYVKMQPCKNAICGTIVRTFKDGVEYQSPNIGKQIVIDMAPQGGGSYAGKVWRPSNDKIYIGKMDLKGSNLFLRGCIAGGLICGKQVWARVK